MLTIYATKETQPHEEVADGTVVHPVEYTLLCKDVAGNQLEINTDKDTYVEVTNFIDALKHV